MQENLEIRPKNFEEFIGQIEVIKTLKVLINSALKRKKPLDHILFHGPPGLGKTTLTKIVAQEVNSQIKFIQGALLEKKSDILAVFGSIQKNDIVFIDEIHSINKNVEELLYSAMEEYVVDIQIGVDGENKIMRMKLPEFTLIGATTMFNKISQPLKDRFGFIAKLKFYSIPEMVKIASNSINKLNIFIDTSNLEYIAKFSNYTPRILNNILKRIRDFFLFEKTTKIDKNLIDSTLKNIGIYYNGLSTLHLEYLNLLANIFKQKSASLDVLSGILKESKENILKNIEPNLLELNLVEKTSKGRKITEKGVNYLKKYN
ncbi:Holliday junction branch migration DNA helicase RuvB [Mesomycoplasma molare]|uniref:Holliday junction branch migration complex subunit RuvB n=1 Tax=Mesomycoplasma molare TaxID=171288 RepID=A0ABY5TUL4_9BACT|nr:Holliday junction branch migration DNA helicase RuvB [Mesomycoplasma molare]UWD34347.1 Holliday junction branch migration DNA helicase RuvB [Mesomycoplasma molare]